MFIRTTVDNLLKKTSRKTDSLLLVTDIKL